MRHRFRFVVPVVVLCLAAGCASSAPVGSPDPFPPRPQAIDISRLDPCALLTPEQLGSRGLRDAQVQTGTPPVGGRPTRVCDWSDYRALFGYAVQFIPRDASEAVGGPGTVLGSIEGYGTVRVTAHETVAPLCEIYVDVDEGQLIRTQTQVSGLTANREFSSLDETCREAESVTAEVIRNARALVS